MKIQTPLFNPRPATAGFLLWKNININISMVLAKSAEEGLNISFNRYTVYLYSVWWVLTMKVEVTIDKHKKLPDGAVPALEKELLRRLSQSYDDCKLRIRITSNDGLSVLGGADGDKKRVEQILQETWESADDWFY